MFSYDFICFYMSFFHVIWFHVCICFYIFTYDLVCAYMMLLCVRICSFMIIYDVLWSYIYSVLLFFVFYDPVYSMMLFRCFSMILYVIVCAYDYLLWWCMFLYSSMTLFIWSSIILHVICLYIFFMSRSHGFICPHTCFYVFLSELSTFSHHDL